MSVMDSIDGALTRATEYVTGAKGNGVIDTIENKVLGTTDDDGTSLLKKIESKVGHAASNGLHTIEDKMGLGGLLGGTSAGTSTSGNGAPGSGPDASDDPDKKKGGSLWDTLENIPILGLIVKFIHFIVELVEGLFGGGDAGSLGAAWGQEANKGIKKAANAVENSEPVKAAERGLDKLTGHKAAAYVNYLTDPKVMGADVLTETEAKGMIANYERESGLNYRAIGDRNMATPSEGMGQWRGERLKDFEKMFGHPMSQSTPEEQLRFGAHEIKHGKEQKGGHAMDQAGTSAGAAAAYTRNVERPANPETQAAISAHFADALDRNPEIIHRGKGANILLASDDKLLPPAAGGKKPTPPNLQQNTGATVQA